MKALPIEITRRLGTRATERLKPLCILLNDDMKVVAWSGNTAYYGLRNLKIDDDGRHRFPFIVDLSIENSFWLPLITLANGNAADIEVIRGKHYIYLLFVDATERRDREQELQQKANELRLLNYRQEQLMEKLNAARDELEIKRQQSEEASLAKSRFISGMSHEFRTPLTSILGYLEVIKEHSANQIAVLKYLPAIERSARHLLSLIENVLDHARLEANQVVISPVPTALRPQFRDLDTIFRPLAEKKKLKFTLDICDQLPEKVLIDSVRMHQILINLIGNAIKFTKKGHVAIDLCWQNGQLFGAVSDTGPGIPKHMQATVFQPFQRLQNEKSGAGLGLSITKDIVELMSGTISIKSAKGKGSTFNFHIPAAKTIEDNKASVSVNVLSSTTNKGRILLAEDNDDIVQLVELFLTDAGYELLTASDGKKAVSMALRYDPDLVLMDLNLPELEGLMAIEQLRNSQFGKPIIALTASPSEQDRRRAFDSGCDDYLLKPIDLSKLIAIADEFID